MAPNRAFFLVTFLWLLFDCYSDGNFTNPPLQIDIISPGFFNLHGAPSLWQAEPVFAAGIDYLTLRYPQFKWSYQSVMDPTMKNCGELRVNVQYLLARWYYTRRKRDGISLPVIITFGCEDSAEMNVLAAGWDVLLITGLNFVPGMENREVYPTFLTTAEITPSLSVLYCELLRTMKWSTLYMLHDVKSSDYYSGRARTILDSLRDTCSLTLHVTRNTFSRFDNDTRIMTILTEFNARSRVLMFFGDSEALRKIMVMAQRHNMTRGEHVYLAVLPFESDMFGNPALWQPSSSDDETIHQAYQAVVLLRLVDEARYKTPLMQKFIQKWLTYPGPDKQLRNKLPNMVSLHIALELAGIGINQTYTSEMQTKKLLPSGTAIANSLLNRTFDLAVGETPMMASAQVSHRHFISSYDLALREYLVFLQSSSDPLTYTYSWNRVSQGHWFGGRTFPPNEPLCGFDGNAPACHEFSRRELPIGISIGALFALCLLLVIFAKIRQTHKLNDPWWTVLSHDIQAPRKETSTYFYALHH